jgi:small subunit ribosomal protein S2
MADVTMRQMLEAGVHFGHQTRYWSPKMAPYIYGERNNIHIFNLERSLPALQDAANYLGKIAAKNGKVLFVGTKRAARDAVKEYAEGCNMPYVNRRWSGGMMTNFKTVKRSVKRLLELEAMQADGSMERLSKKEALGLEREHAKLDRGMGGLKHMERLPDVLFVIDVGHERIAVSEAKKLGIPVVAIVDSNNSPDGVDYVIPGNDDAIRSIQLYSDVIAKAITDGKRSSGKLDEEMAENVAQAGAAIATDALAEAAPVETAPAEAPPVESAPAGAAETTPSEAAPAPAADTAPAEATPAPAAENATSAPAADTAPAEATPAPAAETAASEAAPAPAADTAPAEAMSAPAAEAISAEAAPAADAPAADKPTD